MDPAIEIPYAWVRATRARLMAAMEALDEASYTEPQPVLAGASVRDRFVHIADCYDFWLRCVGLEEGEGVRVRAAAFPDLAAARAAFVRVDALVGGFSAAFARRLDEPLARTLDGAPATLTARWLLAHPVTHEFHHKGQIVVALRLMGVDASDNDLAKPLAVRGAGPTAGADR